MPDATNPDTTNPDKSISDKTDREKAIYYEAIAIQDSRRRTDFLAAACRDDAELCSRVQSLLDADNDAGSFLGRSPLESLLDLPGPTVDFPSVAEGSTVGRYKLLEQIGEGGFGVVYMAEQREPIQRRVALKVIKAGMDTKQVIARFEAERQALALMDHPNIARVLDAGATEAGRPFFVMELVRGIPVTEYCDEQNLSTEERLEVFTDVCSAVQHAHQKGIIHRDIKPNNVLVTTDGDRPVAKVIDFGIAKATQGRLTDKTLFTHFRQFIGTPAYMSPEQAQMSAHDVDTRADIYSLGILLYELLTGSTPLDATKLQTAALDEICRQIREDEPPKPSTRLATITQDERANIARNRRTEPKKLGRLMRGELDWIVMKAIEKDRTRRYGTAAGLLADISRYLANEPVEAGPPTIFYRLQKFTSRNWVAVSTTVAIAMALIVGTVASTIGFVQARRAQSGLEITKGQLTDQLNETNRARHQVEINLYVSDMNRAANAYDDGDMGLALSLLDEHEESFGDRFEWRCLHRLFQGEALHTFREHAGPVNSVAVSMQGVIASGSSDGTFRLFDLKTRREIASREMSSGVRHVDFTPDGQILAVAEDNNKITVWDVKSLEQIAVLPNQQPFFSDMEFSPDGVTLALESNRLGGPLLLWNWRTRKVITVSSEEVKGRWLSISPTGKYLSLVGPTGQVSLAELNEEGTYKKFAEIRTAHGWSVFDSAFSRTNEKYLATAGKGGQIRMWDLAKIRRAELAGESAKPVSILRGKRSSRISRTLSFSPDGRYLASGGERGNVTLWRGSPPWKPEEPEMMTWRGHTASVTSIAYSYDGAFIVSGSKDHTVKLWPGDTRRTPEASAVAEDMIFTAAFSPDDQTLATGSFDGRVMLFDTETMEKRFDEKLHDNQVMGVAISPNGQWLASCEGGWRFASGVNYGSPGRGISLVNLRNREQSYYIDEIPVSVLGAIDFSPDSRSLVIGDAKGCLWLWDVEQRRALKKAVETGGVNIWSVSFSPDAKTIAVSAAKRPLELRKADSFELISKFGSGLSLSVDFSSDGQFLAYTQGQRIKILDTSHLRELKSFEGHADTVWGIAFLPDQKTLASCSMDRTVKLWNIETGHEVATLRGHREGVYGLAVSHDGNMLASASNDETVRIWHASPLDGTESKVTD